MSLPVSISPCPIVEAMVDVRFATEIPPDAIFGVIYQSLREEFPTSKELPAAKIPAEVRRTNPSLATQPLYRLECGERVVLIGPQSVAVGITGSKYPGWQVFSEQIRSTLARVISTGVIHRAHRFGLRYINFFPENILPSLTLAFALEADSLSGEGTFFKTVIAEKDCKLLVQVGRDLSLAGDRTKKGSVIDIDAFVRNPAQKTDINASISEFLESAHSAEKQLFYRLLRPEFLKSLNPTY